MVSSRHSKGGVARAAKLTPERRSEIAVAAAKARWGQREKGELQKAGKRHGKGGVARAAKLTCERRGEIALPAAMAGRDQGEKGGSNMVEPETGQSMSVAIKMLSVARGADTGERLVVPRSFVETYSKEFERLRWHRVVGDAMAPGLLHGDLIVLELSEVPLDGDVHVVAPMSGICIRRVRIRLSTGWVVSCDNEAVRDQETVDVVPVVGVVRFKLG